VVPVVEQRGRRRRFGGTPARTGAAAPFDLPAMIHKGQSVSTPSKILDLLKRGGIVAHIYALASNGMLDDSSRLLPDMLTAHHRGTWFDLVVGT
jgi:predicted amidohydrolase